MKTMFRAAIALFSLASIGSAMAGEGEETIPNTQFTQLPGVIAQAPAQDAQLVMVAQDGHPDSAYVTTSRHGTWLFLPYDGAGDNR